MVCDMLAMCGWRVRRHRSAHAPSETVTFWRRFDGARPVQVLQETSCGGLPSASHPRGDGRWQACECPSRVANLSDELYQRGFGSNTEKKSINGAVMRAGTPGKGF